MNYDTTNLYSFSKGSPDELGANWSEKKTNFAVYSKTSELALCLFHKAGNVPFAIYHLDPVTNRTGHVWHISIKKLPASVWYAYKTSQLATYILDPYAKGVVEHSVNNLIGAIISPDPIFDWENDVPPGISKDDLIIYEMHVRGFTQGASSCVENPGTFQGVIDKIPHLKRLGINAVELMPIQFINPSNRANYWGYSTLNFFSLADRYSTSKKPAEILTEFKKMVRELHKNGIEVILDIVLNHTDENDEETVVSFKALASDDYYTKNEKGEFLNFSGCGNTLNCNHPIVRRLLIDCLKYWVKELHVDGFRFDLATIFFRDGKGHVNPRSIFLEEIASEPVLLNVKMIAEPWDMNHYALGQFAKINRSWQEWNDRFRDSVRRYIKGEASAKGEFASALCGSASVFGIEGGSGANSINFITAHDGFTLRDLVSYNSKHNEANGENNRDGSDYNLSWNGGAEGETEDSGVLEIRTRQMKNLFLTLMISKGTPMVVMGDEYGHSRQGNNNPWNQDNSLNWFDWERLQENEEFFNFLSNMFALRKSHPLLKNNEHLTDKDIEWHGREPHKPNWWGHEALLHFTLKSECHHEKLTVIFNPTEAIESVILPLLPVNQAWHVVVDTSATAPNDFIFEASQPVNGQTITVLPYSSILLKNHSLVAEGKQDGQDRQAAG